jgi:hypothetical protein
MVAVQAARRSSAVAQRRCCICGEALPCLEPAYVFALGDRTAGGNAFLQRQWFCDGCGAQVKAAIARFKD